MFFEHSARRLGCLATKLEISTSVTTLRHRRRLAETKVLDDVVERGLESGVACLAVGNAKVSFLFHEVPPAASR